MIHQTKGIQKIKIKQIQTSYPTTRQQNLQRVLFVNHRFIIISFISPKIYSSSGHYNMHTLTQQIGNIHQIQFLPTDWLMTTATNQSSKFTGPDRSKSLHRERFPENGTHKLVLRRVMETGARKKERKHYNARFYCFVENRKQVW